MSLVASRVALSPPLEPRYRDVIAALGHERGYPTHEAPAALGARLAELSRAYNTAGTAPRDALAARLGFSFARDTPKGGAAVAELLLRGALTLDGALTVLDYGAGLGATTWGVVRALAAAGATGRVDATMFEPDEAALALGLVLARRLGGEGGVELRARGVAAPPPRGATFDLVLLGQVLSEIAVGDDAREQALLARVDSLLRERVRPGGALVVIEPALSVRTRALMRLRDGLAARGHAPFAPCPHALACPMLPRERDWCHEDLPIDLPAWLVPTARAAGLRWERLTFSYLVLTRERRSAAAGARVVGQPKITKGKRELPVCTEQGALVTLTRLDRHASLENAAFEGAARGDHVVTDASSRVVATTRVELEAP
ncbi:MAG: hypothetical protein IT374_09790 [Polyangiaceae bacterium]|nr:hypothetical protein [Polyangiaceae bacterium]